MFTETVIKFFGSKAAVARALGISQVAVTRWGSAISERSEFTKSVMQKGLKRRNTRHSGFDFDNEFYLSTIISDKSSWTC